MVAERDHATLARTWSELRASRPHLRIREAAAELGVSECELLATGLGETVTRLEISVAGLLHALTGVGRCMALTRNEHAVSEVRGCYGGVEIGPHAGQVVGEHIDLRVFPAHWKHMLAVDEPHPLRDGERRHSIHVFDAHGVAVHKVYLEPDGEVASWRAIVGSGAAQPAPLVIEPPAPRRHDRHDGAIDVRGLVADWDAMTDTHAFFHLLRRHEVGRLQALRLAGLERARPVAASALADVLYNAAETGSENMIFVGNRGCLQVFSGTLSQLVRKGPWFNVLDPGFNLHLREDRIASSWVVRKPTSSGVVTSLEIYDADGEVIALVFRKRDDREQVEDPAWSALLGRLPEVAR